MAQSNGQVQDIVAAAEAAANESGRKARKPRGERKVRVKPLEVTISNSTVEVTVGKNQVFSMDLGTVEKATEFALDQARKSPIRLFIK